MLKFTHFFLILLFPLVLSGQEQISGDFRQSIVEDDTVSGTDSWFGKDKIFHVLGSFIIVCGGTWIHGQRYENGVGQDIRFGVGLGITLGVTKELLDEQSPNNRFSVRDLVADLLGVILGGLVLTLIC